MAGQSKVLAILGLSLLTVLGNMLSVPLFFGVDFLFGSVAVMLAVEFLGVFPAVLAAAAGGICTIYLWGHPYALIIFVVEALVVSCLYRRKFESLVMADLIFWLLLGMPLVLLFYKWAIGLDWIGTLLIAFKQPLNGLFNALAAGLFVLLVRRWFGEKYRTQIKMGDILFHVVLSVTLVAGAIPIIVYSYTQKSSEEGRVHRFLIREASHLLQWLQSESANEPDRWKQQVGWLEDGNEYALTIIKTDNMELQQSNPAADSRPDGGIVRDLGNGLSVWLPSGDMVAMRRWGQGRYRVDVPVDNVKGVSFIRAEAPTRPILMKIESDRQILFYYLFGLVLCGMGVSRLMSHYLTAPLKTLADSSLGLADIASETMTPPTMPEFHILEYRMLSNSLRSMADRLASNFKELNEARDNLQERVDAQIMELASDRERLANIIRGTNVGTWEWNVQTGETIFNEHWAEIIGYSLEELSPTTIQTWMDHAHPGDLEESGRLLQECFEGRSEFYECECRMRHKEGSWIWVLDRGKVASWLDDGSPEWMYGTHQDISERKRIEKQLGEMNQHLEEMVALRTESLEHRTEELEAANERLLGLDKMKSAFVSSVSHELRTPLTSLLGFAKLIIKNVAKLEALPENSPEQSSRVQRRIVENANIIIAEGERLTRLINDVLDLSRIESGKTEWVDTEILVNEVLEAAVATMQPFMEANPEIRMEVDIEPDLPAISADRDRMMQLFTNLLSNAAKFTPVGVVRVCARAASTGGVVIEFSDTGVGIDQSDLDEIFDAFRQVHSADGLSGKPDGTGLGLAICKEIVEHYGGSLEVESEPGRGSVFRVRL